MNSLQRPHEVRLRGLSGTGGCHAGGGLVVEALRSLQGFPQLLRRL
jgi:hypothetical protein